MKKAFALFCTLLLLRPPVHAQLPSGSVAPNFKSTDLKGNEWELYELLRQNKIVVLEAMATWCPPCWNYHNSGALQSLYTRYGPEGTDKLRVLLVEGDKETTTDCLLGLPGCDKGTLGNYTDGISFPILDDAAIADLYLVHYYPTVYIICPNKKVFEANTWDADRLWEKAKACPVAKGVNNAGIFDFDPGSALAEICDTTTLAPSFNLVNLGSKPLQNVLLQLKLEGNILQSIPWTGNLGLYEETRIQFNGVALHSGLMETTLTEVNGMADADPSNNVKTSAFKPAAAFSQPKFVLRLRTDDYGYETYWEVRDEQEKVLQRGGNRNVGPSRGGLPIVGGDSPGTYGNNSLIKDTISLPGPGCYSLHFTDAFGDGLCCGYGAGYYRLYDIKNPVTPVLSGGEFGSYERRGFKVEGLSVATTAVDTETAVLELYPNPATDQLQLSFQLSQQVPAMVSIVNAFEQTMAQWALPADAGPQQLLLAVDQYPPGLYFAVIRAGNRQWLRRFVVNRE